MASQKFWIEIYVVTIKISMTEYHNWINHQTDGLFWSLVFFHFFEAVIHAFEVQIFSGLHFYTLLKTLIACRAMQLRFFKVETLLNNAFNQALELFSFQKANWLLAER